MGQVWGQMGGRLNLLANIICQWGTWRYFKWFGPVGLHSLEIRDKGHFCLCMAVSNFMSEMGFFFKLSLFLPLQDFLGQAYCTLGEVVGSMGSRSEKALG